ncbi:hypothetical protein DMB44_03745 [Thermoplasma sp. Kam2015]|uniref:hypothetical protein n=1 Tax=Thermoplasma sp. Kam2015 TaxID=2094122 RepID=UPI000D8FD3F7|nr:hypothetical protein [Thermoplasma sp. Kam2015]PYB68464.1 hypothetical protein DMB44_03745 [Thermoplasma sp. Kam2015]
MKNGSLFTEQMYICRNCRYSLVARSPIYGSRKHCQDDAEEKGVKSRIKTPKRSDGSIPHTWKYDDTA